jgi:hypothetical protein
VRRIAVRLVLRAIACNGSYDVCASSRVRSCPGCGGVGACDAPRLPSRRVTRCPVWSVLGAGVRAVELPRSEDVEADSTCTACWACDRACGFVDLLGFLEVPCVGVAFVGCEVP